MNFRRVSKGRQGPDERVLLLQCRNLGDAVIGTGLVEALSNSSRAGNLDVLTRPEFAFLYAHNPYVAAVHTASFPMGAGFKFGFREAAQLIKQVLQLRRRHYVRVVNVVGDFRENLLGWLISPAGNSSPYFPRDNSFRKMTRQGLMGLARHVIRIPSFDCNIYSLIQRVADYFGSAVPARQRIYCQDGTAFQHMSADNVIGMHVSAGQESRRWTDQNWCKLIRQLRRAGIQVLVFCAPSEQEQLSARLADAGDDTGVEIIALGLEGFFERLTRINALVCLDSFAVHAAHALSVPTVLLNGSNKALINQPPSSLVIEGGKGLTCYPCYNQPTCIGTGAIFACMRSISVEKVIEALVQIGALKL